jgi:hypothetical protein
VRLPPALAAAATPSVLALLGDPPGRVLELGFGGIHAPVLRLAGFDVDVVDDDPRAAERSGPVAAAPGGRYDAVVAPEDADLAEVDALRAILIGRNGVAYMRG